ncbi:Uncharacterised protein [uncultured archaeon]|nr:Uncharacterised protein [uncultured archaeon]
MIEDKELSQAERNIQDYLNEELLTKKPEHQQFTPFYLKNAKMSFQVAQFLYNLSTNSDTKKSAGVPDDFECFLWVVVTSYYSMFYIANAALSKLGFKVGEKFAHKITQDALLVHFIKNNKLAKHLLDEYKQTKDEVLNLMGLNEEELLKEFQLKAKQLIATFDYQRKRRGEFQYEIQTSAKQHVAQLSLDRARTFIQEMNKVIDKM